MEFDCALGHCDTKDTGWREMEKLPHEIWNDMEKGMIDPKYFEYTKLDAKNINHSVKHSIKQLKEKTLNDWDSQEKLYTLLIHTYIPLRSWHHGMTDTHNVTHLENFNGLNDEDIGILKARGYLPVDDITIYSNPYSYRDIYNPTENEFILKTDMYDQVEILDNPTERAKI